MLWFCAGGGGGERTDDGGATTMEHDGAAGTAVNAGGCVSGYALHHR